MALAMHIFCLSLLVNILTVLASNVRVCLPEGNHTELVVARDGNARFTYYQTGLGACGTYSQPSQYIVALNAPEWDGGSHCGDMITITYGEKTAQAQIVDLCVGCPYNALDLSAGLFGHFADLSAGEIYGSWQYGTPTSSPSSPSVTSTPSSTASSKTITNSPTPTGPQVLAEMQMALLGLGGIVASSQ